jgi:mRNA interferase MazF
VRRGELWTAAGGRHYASKPRPVLVVQDDRFDATDSIAVCPVTSDPTEIPLLRIPLETEQTTGLSRPSNVMVDKVTTMPRAKLAEHIGAVADTTMLALSRALIVFLGIA